MANKTEGMVNLNEIAEQLKDVENGVNSLIVPMLKDTIKDSNKHNTKLFILAILELIIIVFVTLYSQFLIYKQNTKYQEFLSQFEFESDIHQDTKDNSIINSGINIQK